MAAKTTNSNTASKKRGRPPKTLKNDLPSLDVLQEMYRDMLLIRRFEEKAGQLYGMGEIGGFCHLYIGQEAVVVGLQSVAEEGDSIVTSYRDHGHMLACGMDASGVMAELTGREGGYSKGKGGSMHMFSREKNFYGGHGIVAAQVPIGAGLAFAHKYKNDGKVNMAYLGDGAVNQGQVYETFNMAALWSLPVIFVIENNHWRTCCMLAFSRPPSRAASSCCRWTKSPRWRRCQQGRRAQSARSSPRSWFLARRGGSDASSSTTRRSSMALRCRWTRAASQCIRLSHPLPAPVLRGPPGKGELNASCEDVRACAAWLRL